MTFKKSLDIARRLSLSQSFSNEESGGKFWLLTNEGSKISILSSSSQFIYFIVGFMIVFSSKFSSIIRGVEKKVHDVFTYLFISIEGPFKKYTYMIGLTIFLKDLHHMDLYLALLFVILQRL